MRVLILGASSVVGKALAEAFAPGNSLVLAGRDSDRLAAAANGCRGAGAVGVSLVSADLSCGAAPLIQAIGGLQVDLVIDAASAASRLRDAEIEASRLPGLVTADFLSKAELLEHLLATQRTAPAVILVSSVLASVKSPGRFAYSSLKRLSELYLGRVSESRAGFRLLVVRVGTVIDTEKGSDEAQRLAAAVVRAFKGNRKVLLYGLSGRLFVGLFYLQPLVFQFVSVLQRRLRGTRATGP